jgi:acyl dehydratase
MLTFDSTQALVALVGQEVAVSDWIEIDQARINAFADATMDHQWIHVDAERCRRESPYGVPVAHGFLTVSLIPGMVERSLRLTHGGIVINYGLNKVRFPGPVPVGGRVRGRMLLASSEQFDGGVQLVWQVSIEREGGARPVCAAEMLLRVYDEAAPAQ